MFSILGISDKKTDVVSSRKLIIIKIGEAAKNTSYSLSNFDAILWQKTNLLMDYLNKKKHTTIHCFTVKYKPTSYIRK
jgi:hypothetical protein